MSTAQVAGIGLGDTSQTGPIRFLCLCKFLLSPGTPASILKPAEGLVPPGGGYGALHGLDPGP